MEMIDIAGRECAFVRSKDNEKVKLFAKLSSSKYRKSERLFLAEGFKLCAEALSASACRFLLIREDSALSDGALRLVRAAGDECEVLVLSDAAFEKVSTEMAPQGVIAVCEVPECPRPEEFLEGKRVIALDGVRDPGNLGTIMRSALAFGFDAVIASSCADIFSPKTVRASMGAVFSLPVIRTDDMPALISNVQKSRRVFGAVLREGCEELGKYRLSESDIVVIGNEGHGISDEVLEVLENFVKIPICEGAESLNASVAASVVMWEYSKL